VIVYFAGAESFQKVLGHVDYPFILSSYWMIKERKDVAKVFKEVKGFKLFLDSGAFSAFTKGAKINLLDYINFIKANKTHIHIYANLDVIGNHEATRANQVKMEEAGLNPLPVFHLGSPMKDFEEYCEKYDYVAIGGMVPYHSKRKILIPFLNHCFRIAKKHKTKLHGFGMTDLNLVKAFPFFSVDSTSWKIGGWRPALYTFTSKKTLKRYDKDQYKKKFKKILAHGTFFDIYNATSWARFARHLREYNSNAYWEEKEDGIQKKEN